jgi:hypothetical protein
MAKAPVFVGAEKMVSITGVDTLNPPASVAVTVNVIGEPTVVEGTPDIVVLFAKLSPAGKPAIESTKLLGVSLSVNVLVGIEYENVCPTVADWGEIAIATVGAVLVGGFELQLVGAIYFVELLV